MRLPCIHQFGSKAPAPNTARPSRLLWLLMVLASPLAAQSVCERPRSRIPAAHAKAFTLIDLLAVMAMLALLACTVAPVLARSGTQAKGIVCANNLRQMGLGAAMYATENRDYLAFANWDGGWSVGGLVLPGWLYTSTNGTIPDVGPGGTYENDQRTAYRTGLWFTYISDPRNYLCPVDIKSSTWTTPASQGVRNSTIRNNRMSSYSINGAACGFGTPSVSQWTRARTSEIWSSRCYLLWEADENGGGPGIPGAFAFNDGSNYPRPADGGPGRLHTANGSEIVTVGGDVQFVTAQKFAAESNTTGRRTLAWWSPFSSDGR